MSTSDLMSFSEAVEIGMTIFMIVIALYILSSIYHTHKSNGLPRR